MKTINNIPVLGLGTWKLLGEKCRGAVKRALELGYRHIDTANIYGNQVEIGRAIKNFDRKKLYIVSKVWTTDLRYKGVLRACDTALRELNIEYLDLFLIHWPSSDVPIGETLKGFKKLYDDGKIKNLGVSNFGIEELKGALDSTEIPIINNQIEFHPYWCREKLLNFCKENRISVTAYRPVARGAIFKEKTMLEMSRRYSKTPAQVCLRWALQKGTIVIPKASSEEHLRQNMDIFNWQILEKDMQKIDKLNKDESVL